MSPESIHEDNNGNVSPEISAARSTARANVNSVSKAQYKQDMQKIKVVAATSSGVAAGVANKVGSAVNQTALESIFPWQQ